MRNAAATSLAPMGRPSRGMDYQATIRMPPEWAERADAIAAAMGRPGFAPARADAIRAALARGLDELEAELGIAPKKSKR